MPDIDALIADARRAATPGAIGAAPDRDHELIGSQMPGGAALRAAPRASALAVAIDGPGLFVLSHNGERRYARLGDFAVDAGGYLTNVAGARVLGFGVDANGEPISGAAELRVPPADLASHRFASYTLDERGIFAGLAERIDANTGRRITRTTALGRLAITIVPAPERMSLDGETMLSLTPAAGTPIIAAPGENGIATLRTHCVETGMVDIEGDLARLWAASRRAQFAETIAASTDQNARTALGLVK